MMTISDIKHGVLVKNIKYDVIEQIVDFALMKDSLKGWRTAVMYRGEDRFNKGSMQVFVKSVDEFLNDFELVEKK